MADHHKKVFLVLSTLILGISGCQPGTAPTPVIPSPVIDVTVDVLVATDSQTPAIVTATPLPALTLEGTGSPTLLPTDTLTPSPAVPLVSVSVPTNCRTGPGRAFDRVMVVDVGMTYEVTGRYTPDNYWVIKLPDGGQCWLWGQYASTAGDVNSLPEMVPPPTPTPAIGAVSGTITDIVDGHKVANALVTAQISRRTFTTSADGTYLIGDLPAGPEFITVEDGFHKSQFQSINIDAGSTATANFVLGLQFHGLFKYILEGTVQLNSMPAAGATVSVWSRNASAVTDSNGHYRMEFSTGAMATPFLILAELGDARGGVQVNPPPLQTFTVPDILLIQR